MEFQHQPLEESQSSIRLLIVLPAFDAGSTTIECIIEHRDLDSASYSALSYMWGSVVHDDNQGLYVIKINGDNGGTFRVRKNLWEFLRYAQECIPNHSLWIDAICIDQANVAERNHQVRRMGHIYTNATTVFVWLGEFLSQPEAFCKSFQTRPGRLTRPLLRGSQGRRFYLNRTVRLTYEEFGLGRTGHRAQDTMQTFWQDLNLLLAHPYWSRLWIMQEIALAKSLVLVCGTSDISGSDFYARLDMLARDSTGLESETIPSSQAYVFAARHLQMTNTLRSHTANWTGPFGGWTGPQAEPKESFFWALQASTRALCFDRRDRVFGILSFVEGGSEFKVDYNLDVQGLFYLVLTHFHHEFSEELAMLVMTSLNMQPSDLLHGQTKHRAAVYRSIEKETVETTGAVVAQSRICDELRCHTCFHIIKHPPSPKTATQPSLMDGDVFCCVGIACPWNSRSPLHIALRNTEKGQRHTVTSFEGVRKLGEGEQSEKKTYRWERNS